MIFWIVAAFIVLGIVVVATGLGKAGAERKLSLKASALQERAKREFPGYVITSIGPSEFSLLYRKAETKRRLPEKLGLMSGMVVFAAIALSIFPINARDDSLGAMARPALIVAGMIPGLIIGLVIANSRGEVWMLRKMEEIVSK